MSVADAIHSGQLVELLPEYAMTYDPLYLYYPGRRGHSNVFKLIVDALRVEVVWKRSFNEISVRKLSFREAETQKSSLHSYKQGCRLLFIHQPHHHPYFQATFKQQK